MTNFAVETSQNSKAKEKTAYLRRSRDGSTVLWLDIFAKNAVTIALLIVGEWPDVVLADVVNEDWCHSDDLRGAGRRNRHQNHQQDQKGSRLAHQFSSHDLRDQSFISLLLRQQFFPLWGAQCKVGEARRGGHAERNGEPAQPTWKKAPNTLAGLGCNAALPVRLVHEEGAEITNQVDYAKHQPSRRKDRQITAVIVSIRAQSAREEFMDRPDTPQCAVIVSKRIGVHFDDEPKHGDENQCGIEIRHIKSRPQAADERVAAYDNRNDDGCCSGLESNNQIRHHCNSAEHQHGRDDHIAQQGEDAEHKVGVAVKTSTHDLEEGFGSGRVDLELNRHCRKEQDLDRGAWRVPKRTTDAILKRKVRSLNWSVCGQQRGWYRNEAGNRIAW